MIDVMKAHHEVSLPNRSTNREMERAVRTGIELGRVGVYQSGLEYASWEMAAKMQCRNFCLTTINENGLVPWQIMRRTDQAPPRPVGFGKLVLFKDPKTPQPKFHVQPLEGDAVDYARQSGLSVLHLQEKLQGRLRFSTTRDIQVRSGEYPLFTDTRFSIERKDCAG